MNSDSISVERRESLPSLGSSRQSAARDKPSQQSPAESISSEQLKEAEQDAEDPTHEKEVPAENEK